MAHNTAQNSTNLPSCHLHIIIAQIVVPSQAKESGMNCVISSLVWVAWMHMCYQ